MANFDSTQFVKSGVPLGGIGAGKLEIMPSGVLDNFTILNNFQKPLTNSTENEIIGLLGYHFGIYCRDNKKKTAKLLQTVKISQYPAIENIKYKGEFPFVYLDYEDKDIPLEISLEAYSPFIPGEEKNSCLPVTELQFKINNPTSRYIEAALLVNVRNIIGEWCVGRFNQVIDEADLISLNMLLKKHSPMDQAQGNMSIAVVKSDKYAVSYLGEYNLMPKPFAFNKEEMRLEAFELFSQEGELPNINSEIPVSSESVELAGAFSVKFKLKPKSRIKIPVILAWNFPLCLDGHVYSNYFKSSREAVHYFYNNKKELSEKTDAFVGQLKQLNIPEWLRDALLNNLYTFFSSTIWTKRMSFAFLEGPQVCPLTGTLDVRFYSSVALALLFPQLELKELMEFAQTQRADGYIMHDLGRMRLDLASVSTNRFYWKDLNSKFILMVYRDYLWTKDLEFLKKLYPFIKKAFYWLVETDKNKDGLPDNEGADHTFDLWYCYGASSYTSSIFLAALLSLIKIGQIMEDKDTEQVAAEYFKKGKKNFEKKLWQKTHFIEYNNRNNRSSKGLPKISIACTVAQLTGQWYAHLLDLGYIVSKEKVKKAIHTILELNAKDSPYGLTNSVYPDGERDNSCLHSANIWVGINYSFLSLAIYEGFSKEAQEIGKRIWSNICEKEKNVWNQPDIYSSSKGDYLFGDHYMRNLAIWAILFALSKKDKNIENFLNKFKKEVLQVKTK
ncbi:MAG: GH116 family glycosyl hydrolase [Candidatus Omnitrophica bacterium]|nr:GH116 family glycosyl hydrolase [Candidatus Omnitrophota bacterium]MDD5352985.1 GH116 family glycosyl hydrolase [Candidatus Omnitrophota bacterium]MDD5550584.1 GH116 family glycosyl hydrolase [Candidatus Omnitrophota bacterium]